MRTKRTPARGQAYEVYTFERVGGYRLKRWTFYYSDGTAEVLTVRERLK